MGSAMAAGALLFVASEATIVSHDLNFRNPEQLRGVMNGPWFLFGHRSPQWLS